MFLYHYHVNIQTKICLFCLITYIEQEVHQKYLSVWILLVSNGVSVLLYFHPVNYHDTHILTGDLSLLKTFPPFLHQIDAANCKGYL